MRQPMKYAEDLAMGEVIPLGEFAMTREEITSFADRWDPQPFHTDGADLTQHYFGDVVASGAHTVAAFQRLAALTVYTSWAVMAGKALRDVLFLQPVRPGDLLRGTLQVASIERTDSKRALVTQYGWLTVADQRVFEMTVEAYVYRRSDNEGWSTS